MSRVTKRRMRRPPAGVLLFMVVAGGAAIVSVASLREPAVRPARGGRPDEARVTEEPVRPPPAEARNKEGHGQKGKKKRKAHKKPAKSDVQAIAVPSPVLTPAELKEAACRWKASAGIIAKSRSAGERQQLERHLRRFVGPRGASRAGRAGAWVDRQLEALQAHAAVSTAALPDPAPDESEKRRLEQLEKLRQRRAVGLLDHIHGGLAWLALHQAPDGHFSDAATAARCKALGHAPACVRGGKEQYGIASTALALMAMLDFRDQDVRGLFEPSLASAVQWLRRRQRRNGAFPGQRQLYESALALMALAQAAEATGDEKLRSAVRRGLELFAARPGPLGGYRYGFGAPGDLSVTGWVTQAVEMARRAGVELPPLLEPGLSEFLDSAWLGDHRFSYLSRNRERKSLYPVGMLMAHILWRDPDLDPDVVAGWRRWLKQGVGQRRPYLYTLYYGVRVAIAMEKDLPDPWRKWVFEFARSQARKGPAAGAFLRYGGWLLRSGKTLHTAVAVLTLEHALYLR